ncbi:MAG: right-handed parallel beta-helix repeat-containing protein [Pseudolysinimonas sp.]|uniref:right-handed parallel beta-helix repeat-containing protein n=1 Tax=Pseudolysinimonas sp. TaxID=2680009 RepID=UPI003C73D9A7
MDGAVLVIPAGARLLLAADQSGFSTLVALGGRLSVEGTAESRVTIESWNPTTGGPDDVTADGRPYLRVIGGDLRVAFTDLRALGFWSGETGGLAYDGDRSAEREMQTPVVGPDGAPTVEITEAAVEPARLEVSGVLVQGCAFGLTVANVESPIIGDSAFVESLADGLVLDRAVTGATVDQVEASRNARDGIVVDNTTSGTRMTGLVVNANSRNGLVLDGTAPAEGPNSTGAPTAVSGDSVVEGGTFDDNTRAAIDVVGGTAVRVAGVTVSGGDMGIVLGGGPVDVQITDSALSGQTRHAISIRDDAQDVAVGNNEISNVQVGVYVRNAKADVTSNVISDVELHGIVLTGRLAGSKITENELSGTGPSAINDDRALNARVEANLIDGWASSRSIEQILRTLMQPLTIVWMLVVTLVIVALITRLGAGRKRGDPLRDRRPLQAMSRGVFDRAEAGRFSG